MGKGSSGFFTSNWLGIGALVHYIDPTKWKALNFKHISIHEMFSASISAQDLLCHLLPTKVLKVISTASIFFNIEEED